MQIFCIESHQYWKERFGESRPSFGETRSGKKHNMESQSEAIRDDKFEAEKYYYCERANTVKFVHFVLRKLRDKSALIK